MLLSWIVFTFWELTKTAGLWSRRFFPAGCMLPRVSSVWRRCTLYDLWTVGHRRRIETYSYSTSWYKYYCSLDTVIPTAKLTSVIVDRYGGRKHRFIPWCKEVCAEASESIRTDWNQMVSRRPKRIIHQDRQIDLFKRPSKLTSTIKLHHSIGYHHSWDTVHSRALCFFILPTGNCLWTSFHSIGKNSKKANP